MKYRYIAIEGNIGAGKTTLSKELSNRWNARLVLEQFEDNPFLASFYKDPDKYAFPLEMSFLAERYQQLTRQIHQTELFAERILADYAPFKSLIFAGKTLDHAEYSVYKKMHQLLYAQVPNPDLIIFIHQPMEQLMKNISKRGRSYESEISEQYLRDVESGYFDFFRSRQDLTTLVIEPKTDNYAYDESFHQFVDELLEWNWSPGRHVVQQD